MKSILIVTLISAIAAGTTFLTIGNHSDEESLFVHSVYFWVKDDVTADERKQFVELLKGLEQIKSVQALEVGAPANTPRDIVDNSYDIALLVYFKDRAGHDLYQVDPIHTAAVEIFEDWVGGIKIYDTICNL